jgi:hypothetical protein
MWRSSRRDHQTPTIVVFLHAISPPPGPSGKKIPILKTRFLENAEMNFPDSFICCVPGWPLSPHRFLEKSTEQIFNYFRFSEKRSPTHISGTAEDTATKFDVGVGHGATILPFQPQLNTSSGFGSRIFFRIFPIWVSKVALVCSYDDQSRKPRPRATIHCNCDVTDHCRTIAVTSFTIE